MAKRYQPLKEFGRTTKKPKLDLSINIGRPEPPVAHNSPLANGRNNTSPPDSRANAGGLSPNNSFWDDDDDVILLATQVAESQVAMKTDPGNTANITTSNQDQCGNWAPHIDATTSTQKPPETFEDQTIFSEMFVDDDDDFVMIAEAAIQKQTQILENKEEEFFKKPVLVSMSKTLAVEGTGRGKSSDSITENMVSTTNQITERRQHASERQIQFLMERMEELKKENAKLSKDIDDAKIKMESKDGETTLLRDELRHIKLQVQRLKMEKIFSTEAARTECKTKIAELSKQVEAKETALQLKSVEYSVLKMRHADETHRFEMSMRNISQMRNESMLVDGGDKKSNDMQKRNKSKCQLKLMRLRGLNVNKKTSTQWDTSLNALSELIYEHSEERGTSKKQRSVFQLELQHLQTIVAQLELKQRQSIMTEHEDHEFNVKTIQSVCKVFPEFWSYVHSLEFPKNCRVHPYPEYDLRQDISEEKRINLHQPNELYEEERALSLRRYVAALSVICRLQPQLCSNLLSHKHGEYSLLSIAIDAICKLGFSHELCEHFGLLEAFATLLHSLLLSIENSSIAESNTNEHVELLVRLLKHLIFARPSPWIFYEISYCILECRRLPYGLSMLCVNSNTSRAFATDHVRSLYRFSNDSCLLQVYAGLLEIAFPLNTPLRAKHFELLTVICRNHVHFAYYCFANPPNFIHKLLPIYDDDDDEDENENETKSDTNEFGKSLYYVHQSNTNTTSVSGSNSNSVNSSTATSGNCTKKIGNANQCECYTKLCLSVVTLLFQLLRHWIRTEKSLETPHIAEISKISVQLLHIIFCDNYLTELFHDAEETTKHYLCLICKWWTENMDLLQFKDMHKTFLHKLQNSHLFSKQFNENETSANVDLDLKDWFSLTRETSTINNNTPDLTTSIENLHLIEDVSNEDKYFEGLQGYAFNFE